MAIQLSGSLSILGGIETTGSVGFSYPEITGPKAWSAGGALITARYGLGGAGKTVGSSREGNSSIAFGGFAFGNSSLTEEYNFGVWSHGGALIRSRRNLAGAGEVNAALAIGGAYSPAGTGNTCTEEYNGTTWSTGGSLINAMTGHGAAGTQDAGLAFGGSSPSSTCTEEYNGSTNTWSAGGTLTNGGVMSGAGTQNAALSIIGTCTEEYDGSNWSPGGTLINNRSNSSAAGTQNAGLAFGGLSPSSTCTEEYDGSNWTAGGALITGRSSLAGAGTQNAGLAFGGFVSPSGVACTEEYAYPTQDTTTFNFSSTTGDIIATGSFTGSFGGAVSGHIIPDTNEVYDLGSSTNRFRDLYLSGSTIYLGNHSITETSYAAISSSAISGGGGSNFSDGLIVTGSTDFSYQSLLETMTVGGALSNGRGQLAGAGTQDAALAIGGFGGPFHCKTEEYDGTSWSGGGNLIQTNNCLAGAGTQNAGLAFGGQLGETCTEEYNGASWSTGGALINSRRIHGGAGTQNAGLAFGGNPGGTCTEEYDGTSWSAGGALITSRFGVTGAGTQNAGLAMGGATGPSSVSCTEEYDGTSWSAGGALITSRWISGGAGIQNSAILAGGRDGFPATNTTEKYNGTSWSVTTSLIQGRQYLAGAGTNSTSALFFGGQTLSPETYYSNTEEFNSTAISTPTFKYSGTTGEVSATGSFKGDVTATGHIVPDTNETYDLGSSSNRWRDLYLSGSTIYIDDQEINAIDYAAISSSVANEVDSATSASHALTAISSSHASTSTTAASATSASYATTASFALNTSNEVFPFTGSANISGSLNTDGNVQFIAAGQGYSGSGTWSTGNNLIKSKLDHGGAGTQNAAIAFGGTDSTFTEGCLYSCTEEYDGTNWSAGGAMITARRAPAGAGTQDATLAFGGDDETTSSGDSCCCGDCGGSSYVRITGCTEEYNGSSWSAGGTLIQGTNQHAGAGTQNAGLSFGGSSKHENHNAVGSNLLSCTEEYDGSSWSAGGALNIPRRMLAGAGTQNAGIAFGGQGNSYRSCTEEYNGISWSVGGVMNRTCNSLGGLAGGGTQTDALATIGNKNAYNTPSEEYDGTSWSNGGCQISPRQRDQMGAASTGAAVAFGGIPSSVGPSLYVVTEEYNKPFSPPSPTFNFSRSTGETMILPPTTDPGVAGALWNNNGTLAISAG